MTQPASGDWRKALASLKLRTSRRTSVAAGHFLSTINVTFATQKKCKRRPVLLSL